MLNHARGNTLKLSRGGGENQPAFGLTEQETASGLLSPACGGWPADHPSTTRRRSHTREIRNCLHEGDANDCMHGKARRRLYIFHPQILKRTPILDEQPAARRSWAAGVRGHGRQAGKTCLDAVSGRFYRPPPSTFFLRSLYVNRRPSTPDLPRHAPSEQIGGSATMAVRTKRLRERQSHEGEHVWI